MDEPTRQPAPPEAAETQHADGPSTTQRASIALPLILVGVALLATLGSLDGFLGGMASGAGVALVLLGAAVIGRADRWLTRGDDDWWLPSRDRAPSPREGEAR